MAEDLSREALARRKTQEETEKAAQAMAGAIERPELVLYANEVNLGVQADGSVVLQLTYHAGDGQSVRVGDVVMPPAVFAPIVGKGHAIMQAAAQQLSMVSDTINRAVAGRTAMMGDGPGPAGASADAIRRMTREQAGD